MGKCKKEKIIAYVKESLPIRLEAYYHPPSCRGIKYPHIDLVLPKDHCGIKTYFQRGGGLTVPYRYHNGLLIVDLGYALGYPCLLIFTLFPEIRIRRTTGFTYIRMSRSGNLYIRLPV